RTVRRIERSEYHREIGVTAARRGEHESRLAQTGGPVDVAGAAHRGPDLLARLGSVARAHGGPLRCELAAQRLHVTRRGSTIGPRDSGGHAGAVHGDD